jgi:hypothetical protein
MSDKFYLTDRHDETLQLEELPRTVLKAFIALVESKLKQNYFAQSFPEICNDGGVTCGTDIPSFSKRLNGEMRGLSWPIKLPIQNPEPWTPKAEVCPSPATETILEMLEFCFHHYHKPTVIEYHSYFSHNHLKFPGHDDGKDEFMEEINRLFHRNKLPYKMNDHGKIDMQFDLAQEGLLSEKIPTIEGTVTSLINDAVLLLREPKGTSFQTAIGKLWDAFERTKTLEGGKKNESADKILRQASNGSEDFFKLLKAEVKSLTDIGNNFQIRHFETDKIPLTDIRHITYLFFRMYVLLKLMLEAMEQPRAV